MAFYKVEIRQTREWGGIIEADSQEEAESMAHREAQFDLIVDEQTISSLVVDEEAEDPYPPERDYVYYT